MVWNKTSSSLPFSGYESEDLDHAIALSLLEEEQKKSNASENGFSVDEDEQLARALQESLFVESPPHQSIDSSPRENIESPPRQKFESPHRKNIKSPPCRKESSRLKCDVCHKFIGRNEYLVLPFWKQTFCPSHEDDGTQRCCSCQRREARDTKYVTLDDGRKLCLECLNSAIMDTHECQPLYLDIREFFIGLNMRVDQEIPLLLVERQALNEAVEGEKQGHHNLPETKGICLSEVQIVSTVWERPRFGLASEVIEMITRPFRLTRQCEVTAILVLYGLPRLHTGTILAHEMMHAWLALQGYRKLSPEVEEGICQVLAHMWIESEIMSGTGGDSASSSSSSFSSSSTSLKKSSRSQSERRLGEFIKRQIETHPSPVYGDGFRSANEAVIKYGLRTTLDHIKQTKKLP